MVLGVGVDILKIEHLHKDSLRPGDAFLRETYSQREIAQADARLEPFTYYATRFCAKEAVFKSLGIDGEHTRFCEIEILADECGRPNVALYGNTANAAARNGIKEVLVSLSYDDGYAQAFAIAQGIREMQGRELYELKPDRQTGAEG